MQDFETYIQYVHDGTHDMWDIQHISISVWHIKPRVISQKHFFDKKVHYICYQVQYMENVILLNMTNTDLFHTQKTNNQNIMPQSENRNNLEISIIKPFNKYRFLHLPLLLFLLTTNIKTRDNLSKPSPQLSHRNHNH